MVLRKIICALCPREAAWLPSPQQFPEPEPSGSVKSESGNCLEALRVTTDGKAIEFRSEPQ